MHKNIVGYIRLHRNRKAYVSVMSMVKRKTYRGHSSRWFLEHGAKSRHCYYNDSKWNKLMTCRIHRWLWRNFFISAVFRHFVGQALRNVCYSDVSRRHFLNKIATVRTFS